MNEFLLRMKSLLGEEFPDYLTCYDAPRFRGLRVNTLKCTADKLKNALNFPLEPTPFCPDGFYIPQDIEGLGNHPLHHCGAFYIQEPSATSAVEMLGVEPGDMVLDLCAAPGGKSTQIGAKLKGKGLLWSNEIVKSRANILLSNIERMGIANAVVSNAHPDTLCQALFEQFDKVLTDAPCSGEGMFRKSDEAQADWSAEHVKSCAERQLHILDSADKALKPGGVLVYSTCTFSREENEEVLTRFLSRHQNYELEDSGVTFGRPSMNYARRIFPMDGGEGHFAARLRKRGEAHHISFTENKNKTEDRILEFYDSLFLNRPFGERIEIVKEKIIILPRNYNTAWRGLNILRAGVILGELVRNRIEPHHSAFMAAALSQCVNVLPLKSDSAEIRAYLHGEEIAAPSELKGYAAVCVDGMTTGFGKASSGRLKNKYPKGLRTLK